MHQQEIIDAIADAIPLYKVWCNRVPRNTQTPSLYVLITDLSIQEYANCKGGNEWLIGCNLDVTSVYSLGYDTQDLVNDATEYIMPRIKSLDIAKDVTLEGSRSMTYDTSTQTITRQILTFSFWVNR